MHALHYDLDIHTPEQLYRAAKDGRLRDLPGFGPKTEAALRRLARAQGLKVNEYGVFRGRQRLAGETEASVYAALGLPDAVLGQLDLVVAGVHSQFHLSRADQTRRVLKAMDHPYFTILSHPTGRLIAEREPYDIDMSRVIRQARDRGCFLELNAHPERLDLSDVHCQMAREEGVLISIASDAHSLQDLDDLRHGIAQARRGWLTKGDVLNSRPLKDLLPLLRRTFHA